MRGGGRLLIESVEPDDWGNGDFTLEPEEPDVEIEWELELWTHVVAIQEHVKHPLQVPDNLETAQDWVNGVFAAGAILRTGSARVFINPGRAHLAPGGETPLIGEVMPMSMEVPVVVELPEESLDLGTGRGFVDVRVTAVDEREDGTTVMFEAADESPVELEVSA